MTRDLARGEFLDGAGWGAAACVPLAGDASFRRYFRLSGTGATAILMDAPPGAEDVRPFLRVAALLADWGYSAPRVMASDTATGFVLLEDIGDDSFTKIIASGADERELYEAAVDLLIDLQRHEPPADLAAFDADRILPEAELFLDWTLPALTGEASSPTLYQEYRALWRDLLPLISGGEAKVALFDFHADNLHWLPSREGLRRVGLLDFQGAVCASPALDLVSLLEDARRDVPPDLAEALIARYMTRAQVTSEDAFRASYAAQGARRNARILGVFGRLWLRDGKAAYLGLLPRVWRHLEGDLAHPALAPLRAWFNDRVPVEQRRDPPDPASFKLPKATAAARAAAR